MKKKKKFRNLVFLQLFVLFSDLLQMEECGGMLLSTYRSLSSFGLLSFLGWWPQRKSNKTGGYFIKIPFWGLSNRPSLIFELGHSVAWLSFSSEAHDETIMPLWVGCCIWHLLFCLLEKCFISKFYLHHGLGTTCTLKIRYVIKIFLNNISTKLEFR